ncbi:hypothetical protein [Lignipirellula cremea]|uniref:Uncharacterized protein n=1 Tax=Lignipirellula cremea TaxID=2528010 RepID=A0A518DRT0_9BACT|nr:hypothetical protein [Lignipirellula cremea]QDU94557.1 hypothetical protein Pla8534_23490 [Lignipirellula cremea]
MRKQNGSGGTEGGLLMFGVGLGLSALAVYLFFDSVRVTTGFGVVGRMLKAAGRGGGWMETTSTGLLFVPFLLATIALFYDASKRWAWWLLYLSLGLLAVEVLSRVRFVMDAKLTHLLLLFVLFGAGVGLMLRSYRDQQNTPDEPPANPGDKANPAEAVSRQDDAARTTSTESTSSKSPTDSQKPASPQ